ncbi:peptidoglycan DD-metalloendopeptidase family protein [Streptomyces vinaceus]|uniref:peptidoglycan DD-metalloendopeptidase family protein n=1 Tax=Streptomyces vinaceus TaxID=1960 RepID=UPI0037F7CF13
MARQNRHRKPKTQNAQRKAAAVAVTAGAGVTLPLMAAGGASAASTHAWDRVAHCESTGRWNLPHGDADSTGGLQIQKRTWDDFGGPGLTGKAFPYQATKEQQIQVAERILAKQGPGAWTCNAKVGSPLKRGDARVGPVAKAQPEEAARTAKTPSQKAEPRAKENRTGAQSGVKRADTTSYTVLAGDTLGGIAQRVGGGTDWQALYAANRAVIGGDPNLIHAGQTLTVPQGARTQTPAQASGGTGATAATQAPASGTRVHPVQGAPVTQSFGGKSARNSGPHTGTDFGARSGTPVKAAAHGVVVASDPAWAYGTNVRIKHPDGTHTLYAHLSHKKVAEGTVVQAGAYIGNVGSTGNSSGPHLHFEVRTTADYRSGHFLDPVKWLQGGTR